MRWTDVIAQTRESEAPDEIPLNLLSGRSNVVQVGCDQVCQRIKTACLAATETPGLSPVNLSFLKERCVEKYELQIPPKMRGCKKNIEVQEVWNVL
jgi:hypothetical protein